MFLPSTFVSAVGSAAAAAATIARCHYCVRPYDLCVLFAKLPASATYGRNIADHWPSFLYSPVRIRLVSTFLNVYYHLFVLSHRGIIVFVFIVISNCRLFSFHLLPPSLPLLLLL